MGCAQLMCIAGVLMWIRANQGEDRTEWQDVVSWDGGRRAWFTVDVFRKYAYSPVLTWTSRSDG
ncbi:hypothetical protein K466DRAFT_582382 [Polyporus arcularius HHB13444]|uniref:Glutathione S-transferase UstS-like C-terminal domain-containing protein n=1 Tax=Polyporus arcularius HHB13444 TaxID=1314778 RepID=A0A5C3PUA4_9APHY|nr:hypothetical protein K466DRAFT_582382 [Polyporus arcularius HHB13444]